MKIETNKLSQTKILSLVSILDYYDRPLIIQLTDSIGGSYLGLVRELTDSFAVIGTPPDLMYALKTGSIDLNTVILKSELMPWYVAQYRNDQRTLVAQPQTERFLDVEPLPDKGSYLQVPLEKSSNDTLKEALNRESTIIKLSLDSFDIRRYEKLSFDSLRTLLYRINSLLNSASYLPVNLDVIVPAQRGSYELLLDVSSSIANTLVSHNEVVSGLRTIDSLLSRIDYVDQVEDLIMEFRQNSGMIRQYYNLLDFLNRGKSSLAYAWAEYRGQSSYSSLSLLQAQNLVASFNALVERNTNISVEIEISGLLVSCNIQKGTWGLLTESNDLINGFSQKETRKNLEGLVIGNEYNFKCLQRASRNTVLSGLEPNLYFIEY